MKSPDIFRIVTIPAAALCACLAVLPAARSAAGEAASGRNALSASGRAEPVGEERRLQFSVPGRIAKLAADDGRDVKAGEVLAELDNSEEKAALAEAEAGVKRAEAALERLEKGARAEECAVADAEVAVAAGELARIEKGSRKEDKDLAAAGVELRKAETVAAERVAARVKKLREGDAKAASQEELESAEDRLAVARSAEAEAKARHTLVAAPAREEDVSVAKARVKLAEDRAALTKAKARAEDIASARAAVDSAKAAVALAQARLEKTLLRAPIDGTVLKVHRRSGEVTAPGAELPVVTMGDLSKIMVRAEVDETDIAKLRVGQAVSAQASCLPGTRLSGKVVMISKSMGRKRLFSDSPREKIDTKVLEVLVELDGKPGVPVGYRLDCYFAEEK